MLPDNDYTNLMTVDVVEADRSLVMYLIGECETATAPLLTQELRRALSENKSVILEVHLLTYIDSTGMSVIASAHESLTQHGLQLRIVGAHGLFERILRITNLDGQVPQDESVDDALSVLARVSAG